MLKNILKIFWIILLSASILKADNFKFIYSDELKSFPSEYIAKSRYMDCKVNSVSEKGVDKYDINVTCLDSTNSYYKFNNSDFKVATSNKNLAIQISKLKNKRLLLFGKLRLSQSIFFNIHIFDVFDIQYKNISKKREDIIINSNKKVNNNIFSNKSGNSLYSEIKLIKNNFNNEYLDLEIEYPNILEKGSFATITIKTKNKLNKVGSKGGVSIGFPQYANIKINKNISDFTSSKGYPQDSKLWSSSLGKNILSKYFMYEGWQNSWNYLDKKTISFSVYISEEHNANTFDLLIRTIIINNKIEYINPTTGIEGQQGYMNIHLPIKVIEQNNIAKNKTYHLIETINCDNTEVKLFSNTENVVRIEEDDYLLINNKRVYINQLNLSTDIYSGFKCMKYKGKEKLIISSNAGNSWEGFLAFDLKTLKYDSINYSESIGLGLNKKPIIEKTNIKINNKIYNVPIYTYSFVEDKNFNALFRNLLKDNYDNFINRVELGHLIEENGNYYVGSGLMKHSGGSDEAIFTINKSNGNISVGILSTNYESDEKSIQYFGEITAPIFEWADTFK